MAELFGAGSDMEVANDAGFMEQIEKDPFDNLLALKRQESTLDNTQRKSIWQA